MAYSDQATCFPVYGQAFDFTVCVKNSTTGNPLTGGLSTLAVTISKDGAAFASAAGTVTEIGTTGYVKVSLTAVDMTAKVIAYNVTSATANAAYATGEIRTVDLRENSSRAAAQTVLKLEQFLVQTWRKWFNRNKMDRGASSTTETLYKDDATTAFLTATHTDDGSITDRGSLS